MRILKLHFENINSLRGEHTIDFTDKRLAENGIFAITGPTGSGKSSLLDVILLALFNKTPRMEQLSKTAVEQFGAIITRNTSTCFAEIEYESKGKRYRSKWSISYNRNGNLRDYDMELAELAEGELLEDVLLDLKKTEVPKRNIEIIGLDYDQFVKSVLLSQGEFAKFLKARAEERTELLERITGTQIYREIGKMAFERHKEAKAQWDLIAAQIEQIKLLTDEERKATETQQTVTQALLIQNEATAKLQAKAIELKKTLEKLVLEARNLANLKKQYTIQYELFAPEERKLELYQQVVELKADFRQYRIYEAQRATQLKELTASQKAIESLELEIKKQTDLQTELSEQLATEIENGERLRPILLEARKQDEANAILKSRLDDKSVLLHNQQLKVKELQQHLNTVTHRVELNKTEVEKLSGWLKENSTLGALAGSIALISNYQRQFAAQEEDAQKALQQANSFAHLAKLTLPRRLEELGSIEHTNRSKINELQCLLNTKQLDLASTQTLLNNTNSELQVLNKTLPLSQQYTEQQQAILVLEQQGIDLSNSLADNTSLLHKYTNEHEIQHLKLQELLLRLEREQREAKYADDRLELKPGEACFLCGSTSHPYVTSYTTDANHTKHLVAEQKKLTDKLEKERQQTDKKHTQLQSELNLKQEQTKERKSIVLRIKEQHEVLCSSLQQVITIDQTDALLKRIDMLTSECHALSIRRDQFLEVNALKNANETLVHILEAQQKVIQYRTSFLESIDAFRGFLKKESPETMVSRLQILNETYTQQNQLLQGKTQELEREMALLDSSSKQLIESQELTKNTSSDLEKIQQLYHQSIAKREALLPLQSAEKAEQAQQQKIENLKNTQAHTTTKLATLTNQFENTAQQVSLIKLAIDTVTQQEKALNEVLLQTIRPLGFMAINDAEKALLSPEQVNSIRQEQIRMREAKTSLAEKTTYNQTQIKTTEEQLTDSIKATPLTELENNQTRLQQDMSEAQQLIGQLKERLTHDNTQKDQSLALQNQNRSQQTETERWRRINDLIGDAQGKKFSLVAQQLTLRQLVSIANRHLNTINDRYLIKQENENSRESLIVIDTYQGNTERSVRTLSGGESFLVSLSLALALSDLAGQNTRIESLFIDEGFGTLDQETLDIALDALEKLQHSSQRTIGIISHVPALKERIRSQIELQKSATGFSSIRLKPDVVG